MIRRIDPYSGEVFFPKRNNQRFASRKNQIAFNNAKAKITRDMMAEIDYQIRKNWQILLDILKDRDSVIKTKDYLLGCGFKFNFFNSQRLIDSNFYFGIYNLGIRMIDSGLYEIINFEKDD